MTNFKKIPTIYIFKEMMMVVQMNNIFLWAVIIMIITSLCCPQYWIN